MQNLILKINFYFARYVIYNIHCKKQSSAFHKAKKENIYLLITNFFLDIYMYVLQTNALFNLNIC